MVDWNNISKEKAKSYLIKHYPFCKKCEQYIDIDDILLNKIDTDRVLCKNCNTEIVFSGNTLKALHIMQAT